MQGSWLDSLDALKHQSFVLIVDGEYHLRTPGGGPYCQAEDPGEGERIYMVLADAEELFEVTPCEVCLPREPSNMGKVQVKDTKQMSLELE